MANFPWRVKGRITARYHVQVELVEKAPISQTPVHAVVRAKVLRVFRGDDQLPVGSEVRFSVAVARTDDDREYGRPWMLPSIFESAKYMEVFLDGSPPECEICSSQAAVILKPIDSPSMRVPSESELDGMPLVQSENPLNTSNVVWG